MKVIFFGTPFFAATILDMLLQKGIHVVAVVTKPDKPLGRSGTPQPPAVKKLALERNIPVFQPKKASDPQFVEEVLRPLQADLYIVVAYSEILKDNLLAVPPLGCVNVHGSLLPKYRGAAPIQWALIEGEKETGISIIYLAPELDAGDILGIAKLPIREGINAGELMAELAPVGGQILLKVLDELQRGTVTRIQQDPTKVTHARKLKAEDGKVNWQLPAQQIHQWIRGVNPNPGAWCWVTIRGVQKRLAIHRSSPVLDVPKTTPGAPLFSSQLIVGCGEGALQLLNVQLEGKKAVTGEEFLRGYPLKDLSFS